MSVLIAIWLKVVSITAGLAPLFMRLTLAYGFFEPATKKLSNIESVASWFGSIGIPFPLLNAYAAAGTEITGVVLLTLGLATRLIAVPLIVVMIVAVVTVHLANGFSCGANGFEIPFYYGIMLFTLIATGAGPISLDALVRRWWSQRT